MTAADRIPALDGLRGFAALLVVVAHLPRIGLLSVSPALSGALGVMLFFILSGFLMGHLYLYRSLDRPSGIHYITARIARVFPLYYLVVITCYVASEIFGRTFTFYIDEISLLRLLTLTGHNYVFWSIPPEIQFYFVFLLIWWFASRGWIVPLAPVLLALVALIFLARPYLPGISALGQLHIFLVGVAIAVLRRRAALTIDPQWAVIIQVGSLACVLMLVSGILPVRQWIEGAGWVNNDSSYGSIPLALLVGSVLLAYTVDTPFARAVFANPLAERLGAFSFALYLLHWPVMAGINAVLAPTGIGPVLIGLCGLAATIAVSAATYYLYEMPMQRAVRSVLSRAIATIWPGSDSRRVPAE